MWVSRCFMDRDLEGFGKSWIWKGIRSAEYLIPVKAGHYSPLSIKLLVPKIALVVNSILVTKSHLFSMSYKPTLHRISLEGYM